LHHYGAVLARAFFSIGKFPYFHRIFLALAHFQCLWKSCECHVNVSTGLRTLFACSNRDSARESIQFDSEERGPANLNGLRGTTGAQKHSFLRGQELQGVML
jgi:hypothetical protein